MLSHAFDTFGKLFWERERLVQHLVSSTYRPNAEQACLARLQRWLDPLGAEEAEMLRKDPNVSIALKQ